MRSINSKTAIQGFLKWIAKNGHFKVLVTNNASYYTSESLKNWCEANEVQHIFSAPYHHQSMGLIELYHKTLIDRIRKMRFTYQGSWSDYVEPAVEAINEAEHSITGFTPDELWVGTPKMLRKAEKRMIDQLKQENIRTKRGISGQLNSKKELLS